MSVHHTELIHIRSWILRDVGYTEDAYSVSKMLVSMISGEPEIYYVHENATLDECVGTAKVWTYSDGKVSVGFNTETVYYWPCDRACCQSPSLIRSYQSINMNVSYTERTYRGSDQYQYVVINGVIIVFDA